MTVTPEPVLLKPRIDEFLTYCKARNLSPNSVRAYRSDLIQFVALCGRSEILASHISRKLIRRFVLQLNESGGAEPSSVKRKLAAVKNFCKWLGAEGLIEAGLIESIPGPRRRDRLPDVPKEEQVKKLLDGEIPSVSPERDRIVLELLYGSGLRASELVGINLDDFRDRDVLLVRGKSKKERLVIVSEYAQAAIKVWLPLRAKLLAKFKLETPALLFSVGPNRSVERLEVRSVGRIVKAVAKAKGMDPEVWHPHLLRHCFGTHMHDHGAPLQGVATLLGHAKLSTAQIYTRVSVGRMMQTYRAAHPHALRS
ncbi:MAG TPA: tyrosine-type recombinase/integrase [Candidatus Sulfotelmatobacter sp.]|nr:tyrosine-type recombinase/integrase [Candidatus Sulfotelmatobacter sp.]